MTRECVTHHFACDCREEKFRELEAQNAELRAALGAAQNANVYAAAELRHAWRGMSRIIGLPENWKGFDSNLIDRAIVALERSALSRSSK
jgi:hypothetical protein